MPCALAAMARAEHDNAAARTSRAAALLRIVRYLLAELHFVALNNGLSVSAYFSKAASTKVSQWRASCVALPNT